MPMLNKEKIIFLFTPGPMGGAEKVVIGGMKSLLNKNIDVQLWIIKEERVPHIADAFIAALELENIPYRKFSSHGIFDRSLLKDLKESLLKENPSLIHAHGFKAAFYGHFVCPKNSHYVITHHGKTSHTLKVKIYEFIELQVMKKADAVVAVSQDMKRMLLKSGLKKDQVLVVENLMTSSIVEKKKSPSTKLKLLFVGRLSSEKGCDIFIEALKKLPSNLFDISIVGDGIERSSLESKSEGLNVQFLGFKNNVNEIMAEHDILVMPSYREGQPLTLIEACCIGLPIIASKVGGIPELVNENMNGLLFEVGDSLSLSEKLLNMDDDYHRFFAKAEQLKTTYIKRFSSETWAENTSRLYESVLSHP